MSNYKYSKNQMNFKCDNAKFFLYFGIDSFI